MDKGREASPSPTGPGRFVDPVVEAYKRDLDRTLIHENLGRSIEERLLNLMMLQRFFAEVHGAASRARRG